MVKLIIEGGVVKLIIVGCVVKLIIKEEGVAKLIIEGEGMMREKVWQRYLYEKVWPN